MMKMFCVLALFFVSPAICQNADLGNVMNSLTSSLINTAEYLNSNPEKAGDLVGSIALSLSGAKNPEISIMNDRMEIRVEMDTSSIQYQQDSMQPTPTFLYSLASYLIMNYYTEYEKNPNLKRCDLIMNENNKPIIRMYCLQEWLSDLQYVNRNSNLDEKLQQDSGEAGEAAFTMLVFKVVDTANANSSTGQTTTSITDGDESPSVTGTTNDNHLTVPYFPINFDTSRLITNVDQTLVRSVYPIIRKQILGDYTGPIQIRRINQIQADKQIAYQVVTVQVDSEGKITKAWLQNADARGMTLMVGTSYAIRKSDEPPNYLYEGYLEGQVDVGAASAGMGVTLGLKEASLSGEVGIGPVKVLSKEISLTNPTDEDDWIGLAGVGMGVSFAGERLQKWNTVEIDDPNILPDKNIFDFIANIFKPSQ